MDVEAFPRGPAPSSDPDASKTTPSLSGDSKRRKRRRKTFHPSLTDLETIPLAHTTDLRTIQFQSPGVKSMGMITEVTDQQLRISLPHGIEASVSPSETSDVLFSWIHEPKSRIGKLLTRLYGSVPPLTDLFAPGQYVYGTYFLNDQQELEFSLRLNKFYDIVSLSKLPVGSRITGSVRSCEDHGYTISLGIKGLSAFLKTEDLQKVYGMDVNLLPGQLIDGVVASPATSGVIRMDVDPERIRTSMAIEGDSIEPQWVLPGALIHAKIVKISESGILLSAMNNQNGIISLFHLQNDAVEDGWQASYVVGQMVKARVLSWHPDRGEYFLSLKPFLVDLALPQMPAIIGQVFTDAVIHRIDPSGLSLKLSTKPNLTIAYVFQDHLGDLPLQGSDFRLRQKVTVRVIGFHAMDGRVVGSMKESVVRSGIVCIDDVHPGLVSEGSIVKVLVDHVYVSMGVGIEGCARQCGFSSSIDLRKVLNQGQYVTYRVLKVKPELRQVMISLDAKLVYATLPFPTNWEDVEIGSCVIGYVLAIKPTVVIVAFAGEVHGILPLTEAKLRKGETLTERFIKDQILNVWIKSCHPAKMKIVLTLEKTRCSKKPYETLQRRSFPFMEDCKAPPGFSTGDIATAIIDRVLEDASGFVVRLEMENKGMEGKAFLPISHLSDHPMSLAFLKTKIRKELSLGHVLVLQTDPFLQVSRKPSLVKNAALLPQRMEDVKENMLLNGFVSAMGEDFVDIGFLGNVTGRVFRNQTPCPNRSLRSFFALGQSVIVRVVKVDLERQRINLTLHPSRTSTSDGIFLDDAFRDMSSLYVASSAALSRELIGSIQTVWITSVEKDEALCRLTSLEVSGKIPKQHFDQDLEEKTEKTACVLDITNEGIPLFSLKPYLIEKGFKMTKSSKKRKHKADQESRFPAMVEWMTEHYLVVSLPKDDHSIAMVPTSDYNLQGFHLSNAFHIGQQILVERSKKKSASGCPIMSIQLLPLLWHKTLKTTETFSADQSSNQDVKNDVGKGDLVVGTVEKIKEGGVLLKLSILGESFKKKVIAPFIDLFDFFAKHIPDRILPGQKFKGLVTKQTNEAIFVSLKPSEGGYLDIDIELEEKRCPLQFTRETIEIGDEIWGYVSGHGKTTPCLFVNIARDLFATVHAPHFADGAITDVQGSFPIGSLVKGTVVSCKFPKVGLSLRSGKVPLESVGAIRKGTVMNILPQGIYVELEKTQLQGLVPRYEMDPQLRKAFKKGQSVKVQIHPLTDGFHLFLSFVMEDETKSESSQELMEIEEEVPTEQLDFEKELAAAFERENVVVPAKRTFSFPEENEQTRKRIWGEMEAIRQPEGKRTQQEPSSVEIKMEEVRSEGLQNEADFERELFSAPNASSLWIRFMAFFLEKGDVSKARSIAERALKIIDFRKEKERLDVWIAYLNLERLYGETKDCVTALFQKAVLCNDPKQLHVAFLKVLEDAQETQIGDHVIKSMRRRCSTSAKAVIQELRYWLVTGRGAQCRRTLDLALNRLPQRKHVKVVEQAAILEFKLGSIERGREIFEGLVSCYPKRMDLWNVYLDQEISKGDPEHTRALFERATSLDGNIKNMKGMFKRFLQFETLHGTSSSIDHVKEKAKTFVSRKNVEMEHP